MIINNTMTYEESIWHLSGFYFGLQYDNLDSMN